ncbi:MAG: hypothetical protein JRI58_14005 [Deltaproteobacteria bacterium]|nr:hypothetical protein [Deltaproteobacteria bacterium]MBW2075832.1 hypothetical protein [Deltaproteobacteria bacterium]
MIPVIQRYIYEHVNNWPVKIQRPIRLIPLLRSNKEDNGIVEGFGIGKVVFWYAGDNRWPCLVTKIMDKSVRLEQVERCKMIQDKINEKIGYAVLPRILDVVEISEKIVLFHEAAKGPNYEIELCRALHGPERSFARLKRVIQRQFKEMSSLFRHLQDMRVSDKPRRWGDWAYTIGQDFRETCGFDASCLTDQHLDEIRKKIDSVPIYQHLIVVADNTADCIPGPRVVDQITPNIDELLTQWPGIITSVFRFIVGYFRSGPISEIFNDWLYAIAAAITDRDGRTIIGLPIRDMLKQVGLDPDRPEVVWAFIMVTFFTRVKGEVAFHRENLFVIDTLKSVFRQHTERLMEIHDIFASNSELDLRPIIRSQDMVLAFGKTTLPQKDPATLNKIKKVAVFGGSSGGLAAREYLEKRGVKVLFLVDNDPNRWGTTRSGCPIHPPSELVYRRDDYDMCIIASRYSESIGEQLRAMRLIEGRDFLRDVPMKLKD